MAEANDREERTYRLLVVEDDPDLCMIIQRFAEASALSIETTFASTVHEAVLWMDDSEPFDLVLADFVLADSRSGYELGGLCRERMPGSAFTMMSSLPIRLPGVGTENFLRKPFSPQECQRFLENQLES